MNAAHLRGMNTNENSPSSPSPASPYLEEWGLEAMMDIGQLASYLGIPVSTVYDGASTGRDLPRTGSGNT